jgi:deoxyribose-phosphate aldolase
MIVVDIAGKSTYPSQTEATEKDIVNLCLEAVKYGFASVCVNPVYICTAARLLHGTNVAPTTVVGFPLGAVLTETKVQEFWLPKPTEPESRCGHQYREGEVGRLEGRKTGH